MRLVLALLLSACATTAASLPPVKTPTPCLPKLRGERIQMAAYLGPEEIEWVDEEGAKQTAVRVILEKKSLGAFLRYVEMLEEMADLAAQCVEK